MNPLAKTAATAGNARTASRDDGPLSNSPTLAGAVVACAKFDGAQCSQGLQQCERREIAFTCSTSGPKLPPGLGD